MKTNILLYYTIVLLYANLNFDINNENIFRLEPNNFGSKVYQI